MPPENTDTWCPRLLKKDSPNFSTNPPLSSQGFFTYFPPFSQSLLSGLATKVEKSFLTMKDASQGEAFLDFKGRIPIKRQE